MRGRRQESKIPGELGHSRRVLSDGLGGLALGMRGPRRLAPVASAWGAAPRGGHVAVSREAGPAGDGHRGLGPLGFGTDPHLHFQFPSKIPAKENYGGTSFLDRPVPHLEQFPSPPDALPRSQHLRGQGRECARARVSHGTSQRVALGKA